MEPSEREDLFTINYGPERGGRPWSTREKTLLLVIVFALLCFAARYLRPRLNGRPEAGILITRDRLDALVESLDFYRRKVGLYPASLADLCRLPPGVSQETWRGPYIEDPSKLNDAWGQPLCYKAPGVKNRGRYDLWSAGRDGIDGSRDDEKNW